MLLGCATSSTSEEYLANESNSTLINEPGLGNSVYRKNCKICHGKEGDKGKGGASNLKASILDTEAVISKIKNGGGGMAPYEGVLSASEIDSVAAFVIQLRN